MEGEFTEANNTYLNEWDYIRIHCTVKLENLERLMMIITSKGGSTLLKINGNYITSKGGSTLFKINGNQILTKGGVVKYKMDGRCNTAQIAGILLALKEIDSAGKGKSSCFIATATMGDYEHPVVIQLSNFRDQYLIKYKLGNKFIKYYNILSPYPAKIISKNNLLKKVSYYFIVKPLFFIVKMIMNNQK